MLDRNHDSIVGMTRPECYEKVIENRGPSICKGREDDSDKIPHLLTLQSIGVSREVQLFPPSRRIGSDAKPYKSNDVQHSAKIPTWRSARTSSREQISSL